MHSITLFRTPQGWMAEHSDPEVEKLFGTNTLPTPHGQGAAIQDVVRAIAPLNPDCEIRWRGN